jgi:hypothetical protein
MTIVFCQDPTGHDPCEHEIFQIGAVFCTDDLADVHGEFACYIRPTGEVELPYLQRHGISSREEIERRKQYWETHEVVWDHFASLAGRHGEGLEAARSICFDAATDAPFLRQSLSEASVGPGKFPQDVGGLMQVTLDLARHRAREGSGSSLRESLREAESRHDACEAVFDFYGVSCTRRTDAKERANATRKCYESLFESMQSSNARPRRRSSSGRSPTLRRR